MNSEREIEQQNLESLEPKFVSTTDANVHDIQTYYCAKCTFNQISDRLTVEERLKPCQKQCCCVNSLAQLHWNSPNNIARSNRTHITKAKNAIKKIYKLRNSRKYLAAKSCKKQTIRMWYLPNYMFIMPSLNCTQTITHTHRGEKPFEYDLCFKKLHAGYNLNVRTRKSFRT